MKANKNQTTYLAAYASKQKVDATIALSLQSSTHPAIFKIIKNKGLILQAKEFIKTKKKKAPDLGGIRLYQCVCLFETAKALHLAIPLYMEVIKMWVPKSVIRPVKGIHIIPNWFIYKEDTVKTEPKIFDTIPQNRPVKHLKYAGPGPRR